MSNNLLGIHNEPGWHGSFTRQHAEGAIPNGTRIVKVNSEERDVNPNGTVGTVLGSVDVGRLGISIADVRPATFVYWVEWLNAPKHAVFIVDWKIERAK